MKPLLPLFLIASAAQAGTFTPPKGCTANLTVQGRSCSVAHYWTCEGNAPGVQWSGELDQQGLIYVGQIDHEAQWLKSYYLRDATEETLVLPATDPANLTELLSNGIDTFEFKLNTTTGLQHVFGFDRIAERNVVIDGETLHRTEYEVRITDTKGDVLFAYEGSEYVSPKHRRFFSGAGKATTPKPEYTYNDTPVDFIYPGEPGFLNDQPHYNCDAISARYEMK